MTDAEVFYFAMWTAVVTVVLGAVSVYLERERMLSRSALWALRAVGIVAITAVVVSIVPGV